MLSQVIVSKLFFITLKIWPYCQFPAQKMISKCDQIRSMTNVENSYIHGQEEFYDHTSVADSLWVTKIHETNFAQYFCHFYNVRWLWESYLASITKSIYFRTMKMSSILGNITFKMTSLYISYVWPKGCSREAVSFETPLIH